MGQRERERTAEILEEEEGGENENVEVIKRRRRAGELSRGKGQRKGQGSLFTSRTRCGSHSKGK